MNHFKSSLSKVGAVAVVLGMVACGGESRQQSANAPVGTTTEYPQPTPAGATATAPEQGGQYGSAMSQPGAPTVAGEQGYGGATAAPQQPSAPPTGAPPTMGGASGQLNPQYGAGQMGQTSEQSATGAPGPMAGMGGAMDVSSLNDAQLAAVVQAISQGEMQEAQLAEQRAAAPEVKRYARDMLTSHRNMMNEDQSVLSQAQITPSDNAVSQQLRTDAQGEMSTLEGMRGRDFDREFVESQIKDHNKAIELLDRIIPNIKNPQLKAQLQNARPRLEAHLREAERLQQKLQQGSTNKQPVGPSQNRQNQNQGGTQNPY